MRRKAVEEDEKVDSDSLVGNENSQIEELEMKISGLEKELQYKEADLANLRQKSAKDRNEAIRFGSSSMARKIMPLISNMEAALDRSKENESEGVSEGVRMTVRGLRTAMESEGIIPIDSMGKEFDPTRMEAIGMIPSPAGVEPGTVVEVVEEGFMIHDRVLRASRVIVSESAEDE